MSASENKRNNAARKNACHTNTNTHTTNAPAHTHTYQIHMPMHTHTHMHMQQKLEWYTHQRVPRDILTQWTSHARYTCTHSNNVHSATHSHSTNEIIQILVFTPGVLFYLLSRAGGYYLLHLTDVLFLQHTDNIC